VTTRGFYLFGVVCFVWSRLLYLIISLHI